jgi:hypothetical protein
VLKIDVQWYKLIWENKMTNLENEMNAAIRIAVYYVQESGVECTAKDLANAMTYTELHAMLFGWLAAKGLWENTVDTNDFIDSLGKGKYL